MNRIKRISRIILRTILFLMICSGVVMAVIESVVEYTTADRLYSNMEHLPQRKVGLLPGTSKYRVGGTQNLYFKYRIEAAAELFHNEKIEYILVSGDHSTPHYNEPSTMLEDLLELGVPEDRVVLDFAGFRTLDSVLRSKLVFGQDSITFISQPFHNKRAVFIADYNDINVIGYNTQDVDTRYGLKTQLRERLARVKMILDLVTGKMPKALGDPVAVD